MTDRQSIIAKIQAMLALQESTDFEGEAQAAAKLIDKLYKQYGLTESDVKDPVAQDEVFQEYTRRDNSYMILLNAVATYYGAKLYLQTSYSTGRKVNSYRIIGTEGQQIQTKLYFEFLYNAMIEECELAYNAEKVLCQLNGKKMDRAFRINFKKAFAYRVNTRLQDMKEAEKTPDELAVEKTVALMKFRSTTAGYIRGEGANAGNNVGSNVSLNRQTSGASPLALTGR